MTKSKHLFRWLTLTLALCAGSAFAQNTVVPSGVTQTLNGKKYYIHVVEPGQTVYAIARAYGLHYSQAVIKTDLHHLTAGDTVWLPVNEKSSAVVKQTTGHVEAASFKEIVVEQGQTLFGLARIHNTTVAKLEELNPEVKTSGLKAGQRLRVPTSAQPAVVRPNEKQQGQYRYQAEKPKPAVAPAPTPTATASETTIPAIRDRISRDKVYITIMMPLHLDQMDEISTTKFDLDQRGKRDYRQFEFIQFYEGLLLGVEQLEAMGCSVRLNVVDVPIEHDDTIAHLYSSHQVAQSDLVIALLQRKGFDALARLAKQDHVFVVNPLATRHELINGNPYAVKYMPSDNGVANVLLRSIANEYPDAHLYIIHSGGREEQAMKTALEQKLQNAKIPYTFFDWSQNAKLATTLKASATPVVVSIYDRGRDKNRIYATQLLNRLSSLKNERLVLYTPGNFITEIPDVDFQQLQRVDYHMIYPAFLDYDNSIHRKFVDSFNEHYKTEPVGPYAGVAHDIVLYFAYGINSAGSEFWKRLNTPSPDGMLFPIQLKQTAADSGIENQQVDLYRMNNLRLQRVGNGR